MIRKFLLLLFGSILYLSCNAQLSAIDLSEANVIINKLRVEGTEKTKDNVILAESKLNVGDTIKVLALNEEFVLSKRNLYNSGLFNDVKISIEKWTDDNRIDVVFTLKERWYLYPIPILELTGITFDEWRDDYDFNSERVSYGVAGIHRNLTGNADNASIILKSGFQKQIGAKYLITGLDKQRNWGLGFFGNYAQNKGVAYTILENDVESQILDGEDDIKLKRAGLTLLRRKSFTRRHSLTYAYNSIEIPDFVLEELNSDYLPSSVHEFNTLTYGVTLENRNLAEYATDGSYFSGNANYSNLSNGSSDMFSVVGNYSYYHPIQPRKFLSASFKGRFLNNKDIPFYHLLRNAPSRSAFPRGYTDYNLIPKSYVTLKTEYRYDLYEDQIEDLPLIPSRFEPINFRILPKAFVDLGANFSNQYVTNNTLNDEFLFSYGVGVDVVTIYNTPIVLELSQNHLSDISFQFGIGKNF